jgi:membrane-associated phospholipid phosphatase
MPRPRVRADRHYNRTLAPPVRWVHAGLALATALLRPVTAWIWLPGRVTWAPWIAGGVLLVLLLLPYDETIRRWAGSLWIPRDVRREWEAAQQYGQAFSSLLVATAIWLLDPARRRRLADWGAAFALTGLAATALKLFLGRPRPWLDEPEVFLGPLGAYPLGPEIGVRHAWEFWAFSSELWSMPSSHAAYMAVMAVFLGRVYPRLRAVLVVLVVVVGLGRIVTGAHYASDVIAGIALGVAVCNTVVAYRWGEAMLDRVQRAIARTSGAQPPSAGNAAVEDRTAPQAEVADSVRKPAHAASAGGSK